MDRLGVHPRRRRLLALTPPCAVRAGLTIAGRPSYGGGLTYETCMPSTVISVVTEFAMKQCLCAFS